LPAEVLAALQQGRTIEAIKRLRTSTGLDLKAAKEAVDRGSEVDLETGLEIERQQFAALFATEDRTIGMQSFVESGPGKASFVGR